jgi:hypothetical protein
MKNLVFDGIDVGPQAPQPHEPTGKMTDGTLMWVRDHYGQLGNLIGSVLTSREDLSIHWFTPTDRDNRSGNYYLVRFMGLKMGVLRQENPRQQLPGPDVKVFSDEATGSNVLTITAIGAPCYSSERSRQLGGGRDNGFFTELTFEDYLEGKRDKFRDIDEQERFLAALPDMFLALRGSLTSVAKKEIRFSDELQQELSSGELIEHC